MRFVFNYLFLVFAFLIICSCVDNTKTTLPLKGKAFPDSIFGKPLDTKIYPEDIILIKEFLYDKYMLEDVYPYRDTTRCFQWDKIKKAIAFLETEQRHKAQWAVISNYKNLNRLPPKVKDTKVNDYEHVTDTFGIERNQGVPLFIVGDTLPERYGRDGWLVKLKSSDTIDMVQVKGISFDGTWDVPKRYVRLINDTVKFNHVVFVDVKNQNIATVEKVDSGWAIRSMTYSTTGVHRPPYAYKTPTGMFAIQAKLNKMVYLADGSKELGGFAPFASRFTNGAYIHGVPTVHPGTDIIEYSYSLGTTPRSHMCVRTVTSHAEYLYYWGKQYQTIVFVID